MHVPVVAAFNEKNGVVNYHQVRILQDLHSVDGHVELIPFAEPSFIPAARTQAFFGADFGPDNLKFIDYDGVMTLELVYREIASSDAGPFLCQRDCH